MYQPRVQSKSILRPETIPWNYGNVNAGNGNEIYAAGRNVTSIN